MQKKVIIIGSGFSGLSAACYMAKHGWQVTVLEKHNQPGGRARRIQQHGFTYDMGPSWYWMPDVMERFFNNFGKKASDYFSLERLDPSYLVHFSNSTISIPANYEQLQQLFESIEPGSAAQLNAFMSEAKYKYEVGINKLVHKPGLSIVEFMDIDVFKGIFKLDIFTNMKSHVAKYFKNKQLQLLLEFPVIFLGAIAANIPALYSLMNYADIKLGTWYPKGGMYCLVQAMEQLAVSLGVQFQYNAAVTTITINEGIATGVIVNSTSLGDSIVMNAHAVIASADYNYVEQQLLQPQWRNYTEAYWNKQTMAPSCLLYYVGLNKRLDNPVHHQLFFDADFDNHTQEIYTTKEWPTNPLFYVSNTTATDSTQAPEGGENLFFLIPIAAGLLGDTEEKRLQYFEQILHRYESITGESIRNHIVLNINYGTTNFISDYGAYKGNAYGLANTLLQTALLKPSCVNKKVSNLYYTGQLTVPGPGVPPSIISGELVAKLVNTRHST